MTVIESGDTKGILGCIREYESTGIDRIGQIDFTGKLRGESITLENVKTREVRYVKRSVEERKALRNAFDSTERRNFLKELAGNEQLLKESDLSELDILDMKDGFVPEGWQVHHIFICD